MPLFPALTAIRQTPRNLLKRPESKMCEMWLLRQPGKQVYLLVTGPWERGAETGVSKPISRFPFSVPVPTENTLR